MSYGKPCDDPPGVGKHTLICDTQTFQDFCTVQGSTLTISLNMANNFGKFYSTDIDYVIFRIPKIDESSITM